MPLAHGGLLEASDEVRCRALSSMGWLPRFGRVVMGPICHEDSSTIFRPFARVVARRKTAQSRRVAAHRHHSASISIQHKPRGSSTWNVVTVRLSYKHTWHGCEDTWSKTRSTTVQADRRVSGYIIRAPSKHLSPFSSAFHSFLLREPDSAFRDHHIVHYFEMRFSLCITYKVYVIIRVDEHRATLGLLSEKSGDERLECFDVIGRRVFFHRRQGYGYGLTEGCPSLDRLENICLLAKYELGSVSHARGRIDGSAHREELSQLEHYPNHPFVPFRSFSASPETMVLVRPLLLSEHSPSL